MILKNFSNNLYTPCIINIWVNILCIFLVECVCEFYSGCCLYILSISCCCFCMCYLYTTREKFQARTDVAEVSSGVMWWLIELSMRGQRSATHQVRISQAYRNSTCMQQGRRTPLHIAVTISTGDCGYRRRTVISLELYSSSQPGKHYVQIKELS